MDNFVDEENNHPPKKIRRLSWGYDDNSNVKKPRSEAVLKGLYSEYNIFDEVRKLLVDDEVYQNFMRCIYLFNEDLITKTELLSLITHFVGKFPHIIKWFTEFLKCNTLYGYSERLNEIDFEVEKRPIDLITEIYFSSCKRLGVSYRELPKNFSFPKCSGRTRLCHEVLNNSCVSFPSWQSEETSGGSSKKTSHEQCIYRTEDEMFELDIVIEVNKSALQCLETVHKRMSRMNVEDAKRFKLNSDLGARSQALQYCAIRRVYGDKAPDIIDGLTRNPFVAVPLVLNRLKSKEKEWKDSQTNFNRLWREQNEKAYWKCLEQQSNAFKQNDLKLIRPKTLLNQIEILFDEQQSKNKGDLDAVRNTGPIMQIICPRDRSIFRDANEILMHFVNAQANFSKTDSNRIQKFLNLTLPSLLGLQYESASDNVETKQSVTSNSVLANRVSRAESSKVLRSNSVANIDREIFAIDKETFKTNCNRSLMYLPEPWYVFLRLHNIFIERLKIFKAKSDETSLCQNYTVKNSSLDYFRFRSKLAISKNPYCVLLQMLKQLLDREIDNNQYEDTLRDLFNVDSYPAFTFDRLIQMCAKQLQLIVNDDLSIKSQFLFKNRRLQRCTSRAERKLADKRYASDSEKLFTGQYCFKTYFHNSDGRISFELLLPRQCHNEVSNIEKDFLAAQRWSCYSSGFISDSLSIDPMACATLAFLPRNIKKGNFVQPNYDDMSTSRDHYDDDCLDDLVIREDLEIFMSLKRRKKSLKYVAGTEDYLYRKGSLRNAKKNFIRSADYRNRRFCRWHENWLLDNVTMDDARSTADWFVTGSLEGVVLDPAVKIKQVTCPRPQRPPFCVTTRYVSSIVRKLTQFTVEVA